MQHANVCISGIKSVRLQQHIVSVHEKHIALVHEGNKPFKCEICEYTCFQKQKLEKHIPIFLRKTQG